MLRKGLTLQSYCGDGIGTIKPTLGKGMDIRDRTWKFTLSHRIHAWYIYLHLPIKIHRDLAVLRQSSQCRGSYLGIPWAGNPLYSLKLTANSAFWKYAGEPQKETNSSGQVITPVTHFIRPLIGPFAGAYIACSFQGGFLYLEPPFSWSWIFEDFWPTIPGRGLIVYESGWWLQTFFHFHPYLRKWSNLTNIFQLG